jgi:hypothetical protein
MSDNIVAGKRRRKPMAVFFQTQSPQPLLTAFDNAIALAALR